MLGPRKDYARQAMLPHNVPFTLLGAGLLWFGWFGFNGGSALAANTSAALAFVNTFLAPARRSSSGRSSTSSATARRPRSAPRRGSSSASSRSRPRPASSSPLSALALGACRAFPSYFAILWRARTRLDDSLDVVAAHGLGGLVGALLTGVLAEKAWNGRPTASSSATRGSSSSRSSRASSTLAYSAAGTFVLLKLVIVLVPLKVDAGDEGLGLDVSQHGEEAYASGEGAILLLPRRDRVRPPARGARPPKEAPVKLVVAIVRPEKLNDVLEALFRADVQGLTISRVQGHGGETERVETYRGTTVKMELSEKVRLEIGVSNHFVEPTVRAILTAARTGEVGDGKIFVLPVEKVFRIRTGEEDQAAVTPVVPVHSGIET